MSPEGSSILFDKAPRGLDRKRLRAFHKRLEVEVARAQFNCLITGDERLHAMNREFLRHDYPTDVLSFPSGESKGMIGEIAISADRARAQGEQFGHSLEEEIEILMLHGVLHLSGMDHEIDRGKMARAESAWRKKLGLPTSLIARARRPA
jgi:probable rRNA maturation factor